MAVYEIFSMNVRNIYAQIHTDIDTCNYLEQPCQSPCVHAADTVSRNMLFIVLHASRTNFSSKTNLYDSVTSFELSSHFLLIRHPYFILQYILKDDTFLIKAHNKINVLT